MKQKFYPIIHIMLAAALLFGLALADGQAVFANETLPFESMESEIKGDAGAPDWYGGAYSTDNPFAWSSLYGQCTWYAYGRAYERTGVKLEACRVGNACTWYNSAKNAGFSVGNTPKANSIAVFNTSAGYGHVAYVEAVNGDTVTVSEANNSALGNWTSQTQSTLAAGINCYSGQHNWSVSKMNNRYASESLIGYIYLGASENNPEGCIDILEGGTGGIILWGWVFDRDDCETSVRLDVYIGGVLHQITANSTRNDVNDVYGVGANHGFDVFIPTNKVGSQYVEVYAINVGGGSDVLLGSKTVTITGASAYVTGISLNRNSMTLTKGQSGTLSATVSPSNATNKSVSWSSSNNNVATVSNGTVKAVGVGTAVIKAGAVDGSGKSAVCTVTVRDSHTHSYTARITKAATCVSAGEKTYTCSCGASYTEKIAITAHTYRTASTQKASLNKDGSIVEKCTACGQTKSTAIACPKSIKLSKTSYTYDGKTHKPSVTVTDSSGKTLRKGTDYNVSYSKGCKKVGSYSATIKFMGSYSGNTKKTFSIGPKTTRIIGYKIKSGTSIAIYWKKQASQTTGYELQYSTSRKFTSGRTKTVRISKTATTAKTLAHLKKNQTYYIRVRTYKTVRINGRSTKVYSNWSETCKVPS